MNYIEQIYRGRCRTSSFLLGFSLVFVFILLFVLLALAVAEFWGVDIFGERFSNHVIFTMQLMPFLGGFFALWFAIIRIHRMTFTAFLTTRLRFGWRRMLFSFLMWWLLMSALFVVDYSAAEQGAYKFVFEADKFFVQMLISIPLVAIQATFEEILFRGYLMQALGVLFHRRYLAWMATSILFGLLHFSNPEVSEVGSILLVDYIFTGLFLGLLTLMDGGLELAIGFHISNNLFVALVSSSEWSAWHTDTLFWDTRTMTATYTIIPTLLCILMAGVFWRKYRWTSWRESLFGKVICPG